MEDRRLGSAGAACTGRARRPAARRPQAAARALRLRGRAARHPPSGGPRRQRPGGRAAEVGRGVHPPGAAGPAAAGRGGSSRGAQAPDRGRAADGLRRGPAVRADPGPAQGQRRDRQRPVGGPPDEPAVAGRGGLGQDGDRDPGDAAGRRRGRAGRAAGADRSPRAAALPLDLRAAGPARPGRAARRGRPRHQADAADRLDGHRGPAQGAARSRVRWCGHRDRDSCLARGQGPVRRPRPGGDRRAAPVRGRAAGRPPGQGRGRPAARAGDDGDADPANRRHDGVRGPGHVHPDRAAHRAGADRHPPGAGRRAAALPGQDLGADPGRGRGRAARPTSCARGSATTRPRAGTWTR